MTYLKVRIVRVWNTNQYPGMAECLMLDAFGVEHRFQDKIPVFSACEITPARLPCDGFIRCLQSGESDSMIQIDAEFPDHVESLTGQHLFYVFPNQLTEGEEESL